MPRKIFIKRQFKKNFNYKLNLTNPQTLNEKINWLKIYGWTPLHTICADKYAVRTYIKENIGSEYLIPLILETKNIFDINSDNLPDYPVIIKTNHNSGGNVIVNNKNIINWKNIQKKLKLLLKDNYYYRSKEIQYKYIEPCILVEKLLTENNGNIPCDYKVHCFNGKARMIQVDIGRRTPNHHRNWYNTSWEREPYKWNSLINGRETEPAPFDIEKPKVLNEMITLSEILAREFILARIDWYIVQNKLYFGEITFHHDGGIRPIEPVEWDNILGSQLIILNNNKNNLY